MATTTHHLKCWPDFYEAIVDGRKNFEVRYDDRGFQAGDKVYLREYDPKSGGRFTGRRCTAVIGYVLSNPVGRRGDSLNGYVVFSLLELEELP
jgi:hypothetical protein